MKRSNTSFPISSTAESIRASSPRTIIGWRRRRSWCMPPRSTARCRRARATSSTPCIKQRFNLDDAATDELIEKATAAEHEAVDLYHFTHLLNRTLDEAGRARVIEMMWEIVYADGQPRRARGQSAVARRRPARRVAARAHRAAPAHRRRQPTTVRAILDSGTGQMTWHDPGHAGHRRLVRDRRRTRPGVCRARP